MNGIYFCEGIDFANKENIGIEKKVTKQIDCLKTFSDVTVISNRVEHTKKDMIKFIFPFIKSDREKGREKIIASTTKNTSYIYIRKPSLTKKFYMLLKKIKKYFPQVIIIMEIPTYPFHMEYKGLSKIMVLKSIECEKKLHNVVDYIATYSDDKVIWGIKTINLSNCVDYTTVKPRSKRYHTLKNTIRLTCVANYAYWHGIDRLINGIKLYKGKYKIILNVVGGGEEIANLKELSRNDNRIIFYGPKSGRELDDIFDETDIAVDALGRHRSGVYYNSSLKGKEYAARGIPEISSVTTEMDYIDNYKYYLKLPSDDSPINIEDVITFFEKISQDDNVSKKIRDRTYRLFDYKYGFKERIFTELKGAE